VIDVVPAEADRLPYELRDTDGYPKGDRRGRSINRNNGTVLFRSNSIQDLVVPRLMGELSWFQGRFVL